MVAKEIYLAICGKLTPLATWLNIDLFNNQFTNEATENPLQVPCVLVEFSPINWKQQGFGLIGVPQYGDLQVTLHIASELYENTYANMLNQSAALVFFDFVEAVTSLIQGVNGANFTEMTRVATQYPSEYTNVHLSKVTFQTSVTQIIASVTPTEIDAIIELYKTGYPHPTNE